MATYRALILGAESPLAPAFLDVLQAASLRIRLAHTWGAPHAFAAARPEDERVIIDWRDPTSLDVAARACNFIILLHEPDPSLGFASAREDVSRLRAIARAIRDSEVERLVILSCASMLAPGQDPIFMARDRGYTPGRGTPSMDARYAFEQEAIRLAADALDLALIHPGLCLDLTTQVTLPALTLPQNHPISCVSTREVARASLAILQHGRAGAHYPVGGVNTTWGALSERFSAQRVSLRDRLLPSFAANPREQTRARDAILGGGHLASSRTWRELGVARPVSSLDALVARPE